VTHVVHIISSTTNLLDISLSDAAVTSKLMSIDETYLSTWLINNYIGQCAQRCPSYISRLFDDVSTSVKLQKAVSETVRWRLNTSLYDMWETVGFAEMLIPSKLSEFAPTVRLFVYWMKELTKIDQRLSLYFSAVSLLYVAREISMNGFRDKLMDILAAVQGPNFNQCCSVLSRCTTEQNTSELVELLQKSAVEHLTTYRQLMAPDFGSLVTIVTTDFEALYAYKRGDYQRCLQLSTQNVHTLLVHARHLHRAHILADLDQLFDDDIVSLNALTIIVNRECRNINVYISVNQLVLSLYLMTQCQMKLHHSVTSLAQTLYYIKVAQRRHPADATLDPLTLKLIERKVVAYIREHIALEPFLCI